MINRLQILDVIIIMQFNIIFYIMLKRNTVEEHALVLYVSGTHGLIINNYGAMIIIC